MSLADLLPDTDNTVTDFFCGMGGSSTGLTEAGFKVVLAANHWDRAIETHSANHPDADHWQADLSNADFRLLPRTAILWASPICTELSPAGGTSKKNQAPDLFQEAGPVRSAGFERTRATFWDVIRATEARRYKIVLIENVVEAVQWELFDLWLACMERLGYEYQFVSASSAHIGDDVDNAPAPQWRDRLYIVFNRVGIRRPDVTPRPLSWCPSCDGLVNAVQSWKRPGRKVGKYKSQYVYVCPDHGCKGQVVEPLVAPAAAAIDWSNLGQRIGDRDKPLGASTMRRIRVGLETIGNPAIVAAAGNTYERPGSGYVRAWPTHGAPMMTRSCTSTDALAMSEPFVATLRNHAAPTPVNRDALATFSAGGFHHGLTVPPGAFISKHHGGLNYKAIGHMNKTVEEPMGTTVTQVNTSLVIPYRRGAQPYPVDAAPLSTQATHAGHGMLTTGEPVSVEDCYFRMLTPREAANAQRFPAAYRIHGNQGEQQMQAGNAVSVNVAHWLGEKVREVLA